MMHAADTPYPRYERIRGTATNDVWLTREDVTAGHVRLYLPDRSGRLRLIFINDGGKKQYCIVKESVLKTEFGVHYRDLSLNRTGAFTRVQTLDELNQFAAALYPPGARRKKVTLEMAQQQADALRRLEEMMPAAQVDAWL